MIEAPIYVPFVPQGRATGSERLGVGLVAAIPESARALNAPEQGSARAPFSEQRAAIQSSFARQQPVASQSFTTDKRGDVELGARARVAAGGDSDPGSRVYSAGGSRDEDAAKASSAMRQRVELSVRLALPSEEPSRQFSIVV